MAQATTSAASASSSASIEIDWDDGSPVEPVPFQENGVVGVGAATHRYADDGDYDAAFEVCDDAAGCTTAAGRITVANVAPTPTIDAASAADSGAATLDGSYTDPGTADTHTATVDWGDDTGPQPTTTPSPGTVSATHDYTTDGAYTVELCVVDDDGDQGCTRTELTVSGAEPPDPQRPANPEDPPVPANSGDPTQHVAPSGFPAGTQDDSPSASDDAAAHTSESLPMTGAPMLPSWKVLALALLGSGALLIAVRRSAGARSVDH